MVESSPVSDELAAKVALRRTFAIISHPDAGKTTLTEKILLYAGAIELAGAVRGRKSRRHAVSDWMAMEQQRGISLTSTALEFEIEGRRITLLDTPGHKDFSEDTYRSLVAADSVVMVLDSAKGVEEQTRKLFEVCKRHRLPILTFVNKCDTPGRDPLELVDEIESVLGIAAAPLNWPIGRGDQFIGVYDITERQVLLYERHMQGQRKAPVSVSHHRDPLVEELAGENVYREFIEGIDLIASAGTTFNLKEYLAGRQTGVFFGSALTNFGLEPFLEGLVRLAPPPGPRMMKDGDEEIDPASADFSGFVFKIQANMDPRHRDHVAFVRVCSGKLVKDMMVTNARLKAPVRVARPYKIFGRDRETSTEAYAGDIVGLVNPGRFAIGDSLYVGHPVEFPLVPQFAAEHFGRLKLEDQRHKQFDDGVRQLEEEGLMQVFRTRHGRDPVVGVVGALQFDVIQSRLENEYGVASRVEPMNYHAARWLDPPDTNPQALAGLGANVLDVTDRRGRTVLLFPSEWALQYAERENPKVKFLAEVDR
jgi:peptide chain release factor 3